MVRSILRLLRSSLEIERDHREQRYRLMWSNCVVWITKC